MRILATLEAVFASSIQKMVTIKKAAELTGVPEHTLRAWEIRYQVFLPERTPAGYRIYDQAGLDRIRRMNALVSAGWAPRRAAAEIARNNTSRAEVARVDDSFATLLAAAEHLDARRVNRIVNEAFTRAGFEAVVDGWLLPGLVALGRSWTDGTTSVAAEHLVTNVVVRRLSAAYDQAGRGQKNGRPVLIGAPPGVDHVIGLLAFAVAARRRGLTTVYLGARVPSAAWLDAVERCRARAAVTVVPRRRDLAKTQEVLSALTTRTSVSLWLGGSQQDAVPPPAHQLGHRIGPAAKALAEHLLTTA